MESEPSDGTHTDKTEEAQYHEAQMEGANKAYIDTEDKLNAILDIIHDINNGVAYTDGVDD